MKDHHPRSQVLHEGSHLTLLEKRGWEFVHRRKGVGVVGVVALTKEGEAVLVEQYRPPVGTRVVELPAGLIGDDCEETTLEAAGRELEEETGFRAGRMRVIWSGPSSAGLTDEIVILVLAEDLERIHLGGGVAEEDIQVHLIPPSDLETWLSERESAGTLVDLKVRLISRVLEVAR